MAYFKSMFVVYATMVDSVGEAFRLLLLQVCPHDNSLSLLLVASLGGNATAKPQVLHALRLSLLASLLLGF